MNHEQVCHVWANNPAKVARGHNVFTDGAGRIFSYGPHYVLGVHIRPGVVALNGERRSVSTSKHQSHTRKATRHLSVATVPLLDAIVGACGPVKTGAALEAALEGQYALGMTRESVALLLDRSVTRLCDTWDKRIARKAAKDAKDAKKSALDRMRACAVRRDAHTYAYWPHAASSYLARLFGLRSDMRLVTKAGTPPRLWAACQKMIKLINARLAESTRLERLTADNDRTRHAIRLLRDAESFNTYAMPATGRHFVRFRPLLQAAIDESVKRRNRAEYERQAAARADWLAGTGATYWRGTDETGGALLRVRGDTLETSQGARVPLEHAIKAFKRVAACQAAGLSWARNGDTIRVGHFQIDRIEPNGDFWAGCHRINWPESARIAAQLGVL